MDYKAIGQRVRKFRREQGLTQKELAEKSGISVPHVNRVEGGYTKASIAVFIALAKALSVRVEDLVFGEKVTDRKACLAEIDNLLSHCNIKQVEFVESVMGMDIKAIRAAILAS